MYLKSLVLKGFKSFADRSVLTLEPGITAIVGPNGSGKSNICDAVLWVLGERNAKHLRGQAMEDVIFAGSSARKAVGIAEVDLVLDNSDGTLPVEYDEVSITRRMYRSGESEYLINGTVVRRMDVLDILHDSGIGTGTNSIISQGSLDSILQSKPEDRRALIEEAAGVLKHKQRKAKSERKLEAMDTHLARVRDIANEVGRQLGPLERKAKRARTYQGLATELADLNLALAVDNLRALRRGWDDICSREEQLESELEQRRETIAQAEAKAEELQEKIRRESLDAGDLARTTRRIASVVERFEGAALLVREKRRTAEASEVELRATLEANAVKRERLETERVDALSQVEDVRRARLEADASLERLLEEQRVNVEASVELEQEIKRLEQARREGERDQEQARHELSDTRESLASGLAHVTLVESRGKELELELERAQTEAADLAQTAAELEGQLDSLVQAEDVARTAADEARMRRNEAQTELDEAREAASLANSEIKGLEELLRAATSSGPAREWLLEHAEELEEEIDPLVEVIRAPQEDEALVERLLGSDVTALLVKNNSRLRKVGIALDEAGVSGEVVLVPRSIFGEEESANLEVTRAAARSCNGRALIDELTVPKNAARAVEALLGDVVVCDDFLTAYMAHGRSVYDVRFVTQDGWIVWPSGKVSAGAPELQDEEGILSRERRLAELHEQAAEAQNRREAAQDRIEHAEQELSMAQATSLQLTQELAEVRGQTEAARAQARQSEEKLASVRREFQDIEQQRTQAENDVNEARPAAEALEQRLGELALNLDENSTNIERIQSELAPLHERATELQDAVAEAKLEAATLAERETYVVRVAETAKQDVLALDDSDAEANRTLTRNEVAQRRIAPLLAIFDTLIASARRRSQTLEEASASAQDASTDLHRSANEARVSARAAHEALDEANNRLSDTRVEKGRLELQVDAAVDTIVHDCGVPLDRAMDEPELKDRGATEEQAFKLRRRIANMGTINPDAAEEYEQVKERYDYLAAQIDDLDSARGSLAKIVRVIDERMKDDFINTYEEVDKNFREIFAILFPGGSAELTLSDPDDLENTGVEVSAQPRGKRISKMMLLSGGEKSLTALALLFAVYRIRKTPFYILDEVEAALDDSNLRRLLAYLDSLRDTTQLIMITHQRRTMESADVLFGVSMQADGVTKVISQKLDRALQYAE